MKEVVTLRINGETHELYIEPKKTLLEVLREDLGLTGTKEVCELGACGACTVLLDNKPILSCLTLALTCKGKEITTIEGISKGETLHPLQVSFIEEGAIQCGYCTPGMVLSAKALLDETPHPTDDQIETAIEGNLCRCGAYLQILKAIKTVIENNK
jgi:carbon-monoxide dehydrogenase small subunit